MPFIKSRESTSRLESLCRKRMCFRTVGVQLSISLIIEYWKLPESHAWRRVRYDLCADPRVDLSWEREWRVHTNEMFLPDELATVIVPNQWWADKLERCYYDIEYGRIHYMNSMAGNQYSHEPEPFPYHIYPLESCG